MNSTNLTARLTGFLYLLIAIFSAFGLVYVPSVVVVAGDAAATAHNLVASESLFRLGFFSNLLTFTINVFVAVLLYKLLKPVHQGTVALMVILISLGLGIAMLNELNQLVALFAGQRRRLSERLHHRAVASPGHPFSSTSTNMAFPSPTFFGDSGSSRWATWSINRDFCPASSASCSLWRASAT